MENLEVKKKKKTNNNLESFMELIVKKIQQTNDEEVIRQWIGGSRDYAPMGIYSKEINLI